MTFVRLAISCTAPVALSLTALCSPAVAQTSPAYERAILGEMDPATRADVQKRATGGNKVWEVIGTILLNNYHAAGAKNPGEALTVVALDFVRGVGVLRHTDQSLEMINFDPKTLRVTQQSQM